MILVMMLQTNMQQSSEFIARKRRVAKVWLERKQIGRQWTLADI